MPRRPRAIALDLGGVLVDVDKAHLAAFGASDVVDDAFHGAHHEAVTVGSIDGDAFALAAVASLRTSGVCADVEQVKRAWARVVSWRPGALALVSACVASLPTTVWSNIDPIHWTVLGPALAAHGLQPTTSFAVGAAKPDPRFFAAALRETQALLPDRLEPADVFFVDDRDDNVNAARACGVDAVVCTSVAAVRALLLDRGVIPPSR
jgi:FMN phosphatase YigB (HAD superfamily)